MTYYGANSVPHLIEDVGEALCLRAAETDNQEA